jgi:hypothetical protein
LVLPDQLSSFLSFSMPSEQPLLPFESDDHPDVIQLVKQQGQYEKRLNDYIRRLDEIGMQLRELYHQRTQVEQQWIGTGGGDPVLMERLYKLGQEIADLEEKMFIVYKDAQQISDLMKKTSQQIAALLPKRT